MTFRKPVSEITDRAKLWHFLQTEIQQELREDISLEAYALDMLRTNLANFRLRHTYFYEAAFYQDHPPSLCIGESA